MTLISQMELKSHLGLIVFILYRFEILKIIIYTFYQNENIVKNVLGEFGEKLHKMLNFSYFRIFCLSPIVFPCTAL